MAYTKTTWNNDDLITAEKLNNIETGIDDAHGIASIPGTTFTPAVDSAGNLSWSNSDGKPNPTTVNIKGPKGDSGTGGGGEALADFRDVKVLCRSFDPSIPDRPWGAQGGYRIPFMCVTKTGTIIVGGDLRNSSLSDNVPIDIAIRRSTDGGRTWGPLQIIARREDAGLGTNHHSYKRFMDGCITANLITGRLHMHCMNINTQNQPTSPSAGTSDTIAGMGYYYSDDDGLTWIKHDSAASAVMKNINSLKNFSGNGEYHFAAGPGSGIQVQQGPKAGRLVVPYQVWRRSGAPEKTAGVMYSDNDGLTWIRGALCTTHTSETTICEMPSNLRSHTDTSVRIMMHCKHDGGPDFNERKFLTCDTAGGDWQVHASSEQLKGVQGCQGSTLWFRDDGAEDHVLATAPDNPFAGWGWGRSNITLYRLNNIGKAWDPIASVYPHATLSYSCLAWDHIRKRIYCAYEAPIARGPVLIQADGTSSHAIHFQDMTAYLSSMKQRKMVAVPKARTPLTVEPSRFQVYDKAEAGEIPNIREHEGVYYLNGRFTVKTDAVDTNEPVLCYLPPDYPVLETCYFTAVSWSTPSGGKQTTKTILVKLEKQPDSINPAVENGISWRNRIRILDHNWKDYTHIIIPNVTLATAANRIIGNPGLVEKPPFVGI